MNEERLKKAFGNIKSDMEKLTLDISVIKGRLKRHEQVYTLNDEIKKEIVHLKSIDLESFVKRLEAEISNINKFIMEVNGRSENVSKVITSFTKQFDIYRTQLDDFKKKFKGTQKDAQNAHLDMKVLNEHTAEFEMMIDEKVTLENSSLRLEIDTTLAKLGSDISKVSMNMEKLKDKSKAKDVGMSNDQFNEFSEMMNEKIEMEIAGIRMEMQETFSQLVFNNESEKSKPAKKKSITSLKKKITSKKTKDGKIKKAVKWLFVDEDEEMLDNVKSEINKEKLS